jgi:soluble lytic murein transglycosylase-like protein
MDPALELEQIASLARGDRIHAASAVAERLATRTEGRISAAAWMVVGTAARQRGAHDEAIAAYTRVWENDDSPLQPLGAWHLAEALEALGEHTQAAAVCTDYNSRWSRGANALDCLQVRALHAAREGKEDAALQLVSAWDDAVRHASILEPVELLLAEWEMANAPEAAVERLSRLAVAFKAPLTGVTAMDRLEALERDGVAGASLPTTPSALRRRALSLRDAGQLDEAWELFTALGELDDAETRAWFARERTTFAWKARQWALLDAIYEERYAEDATASTAWSGFRAASRGGRYDAVLRWEKRGRQSHASDRRWRDHETVGRALMLAGDHAGAARRFDELKTRRGTTGDRNEFYAGFATLHSGNTLDAVARFTAQLEGDTDLPTEIRYWRAKAYEETAPVLAEVDRTWIRENSPDSWYGALLGVQPAGRDGRWVEAPEVSPQVWHRGIAPDLAGRPVYAALSFEGPTVGTGHHDIAELHHETFDTFVDTWGKHWSALEAVRDLNQVGLDQLAGPLFSEWRKGWYSEVRRRHRTARTLSSRTSSSMWKGLYLYTRDHYDTARVYERAWLYRNPEDQEDWRRLVHPLAHRDTVWREAERAGIDPYLVLSLMRAESHYNAHAVSRVGARGPMQIMPRTGALMAWLEGDPHHTAGDLHDPDVAIRYGVQYLSRLMDRFGGVFPLAVASYNGGPHNVSSWLDGTGLDVPMDVFVESIPFGETRRYVRKVTKNYLAYTELYEPDTPFLAIPPSPVQDDPSVVDF